MHHSPARWVTSRTLHYGSKSPKPLPALSPLNPSLINPPIASQRVRILCASPLPGPPDEGSSGAFIGPIAGASGRRQGVQVLVPLVPRGRAGPRVEAERARPGGGRARPRYALGISGEEEAATRRRSGPAPTSPHPLLATLLTTGLISQTQPFDIPHLSKTSRSGRPHTLPVPPPAASCYPSQNPTRKARHDRPFLSLHPRHHPSSGGKHC